MNYKILIHYMPWEIDYALLNIMQLAKSFRLIDTEKNKITLSIVLNVSDSIINWFSSKIPRSHFIEKINTILLYLDSNVIVKLKVVREGIYGHLDSQREALDDDTDFYITLTPDTYFSELTLHYLIETSQLLTDKYCVVTPQIPRYWDASWDSITHPIYLNNSVEQWWVKAAPPIIWQDATYNIPNEIGAKQILGFKFAGWFDMYSKGFFKELFPVANDWHGYGPWDAYAMVLSSYLQVNNFPIKQFVLENNIISEYATGKLRTESDLFGFTGYYKNNLQKLTDISSQRNAFEKNMNIYIQEWLQTHKELLNGK